MGAPFFWDERPHPSLRRHLPQRRRQGRGSRGAALLDNHGADVPPKPSPLGKVPKADEVGSAAEKIKPGSVHCEGVRGATAKPPCRARRREIPATRKIKPLRCGCEAVQRATAKPSGRLRRGEIPCNKKDQQQENHFSRCWSVAPIWRDNVRVVGKASWGRICGCAKLLAGTLRCLRLCWARLAKWSPEEQLGRCPKPHKGAPPLDPARGIPP